MLFLFFVGRWADEYPGRRSDRRKNGFPLENSIQNTLFDPFAKQGRKPKRTRRVLCDGAMSLYDRRTWGLCCEKHEELFILSLTKKTNKETSMARKNSNNKKWWQSGEFEEEECPITLESLSSLPYPPFPLPNDIHLMPTGSARAASSSSSSSFSSSVTYFDGVALASYIISRGIFENPLTRQELSKEICQNLDHHLQQYCSNYLLQEGGGLSGVGRNQRKQISVTEAYALRSIVQVEGQSHSNNSEDNERARVLRNTATAALAGLFVYGNDRRRQNRQNGNVQEDGSNNNNDRTTVAAELPPEDRLVLEWGFDLSRELQDTSTSQSMSNNDNGDDYGNGWTIVDDDEALVVASKRDAYEATQNAFPPLLSQGSEAAAVVNGVTAKQEQDIDFLNRLRQVAINEDETTAEKERRLQRARQQLLQEALQRREQKKQERNLQKQQAVQQCVEKQKELDEIQQARAEIEAWRNSQWERLRQISDSYERKATKVKAKQNEEVQFTSVIEVSTEAQHDDDEVNKIDKEEQKKAKAAAKRKRAKARKKAQRAEERLKMEEQKRKQELEAKKATSATQCAACQQGILDCGFEKFDQKFCSPKCARTAVRIR